MADPSGEWSVAAVLPNIELSDSYGNRYVALAPMRDSRALAAIAANAKLGEFLSRFTDTFGVRVSPTLLLVSESAPERVRSAEPLSAFRDLVSISIVSRTRALELLRPRGHRTLFSNAFWFHPWILGRDGNHLIINTIAGWGVHRVDAFKGQNSPELFLQRVAEYDVDKPLLKSLLGRWSKRFIGAPAWADRALFRSLNMAFEASQIPAGAGITIYDVGRSLALWVSSFEILVHPGAGQKSDLKKVYGLLSQVDWRVRALSRRLYRAYKTPDRANLATSLYGEIYQVRNDFIHGNPVSPAKLRAKRSHQPYWMYAAPLYRMALTTFLGLGYAKPSPDPDNTREFVRWHTERSEFYEFQGRCEAAIETLRRVGHEDEDTD